MSTTWLGLYEQNYRQQIKMINDSGGYIPPNPPKRKSLLRRVIGAILHGGSDVCLCCVSCDTCRKLYSSIYYDCDNK